MRKTSRAMDNPKFTKYWIPNSEYLKEVTKYAKYEKLMLEKTEKSELQEGKKLHNN